MTEYEDFLQEKTVFHKASGFEVRESEISPILFPHQNALTRYALRKGRSAILADTGLGKSLMELEWSRHVSKRTSKPVLITMPLYVAYQTIEIAKDLFSWDIPFAEDGNDIDGSSNIYITNYAKIHKFIDIDSGGVVWDESSIFKSIDGGATLKTAIKVSEGVDFRLCASATPSPNSIEEMGRQSEILGIMTLPEMQSTFFVNRQDSKNKKRQTWQMRPHGEKRFYPWLASWAMAIKLPSDLGFSDEGYILPELTITHISVKAGYVPEGQLVFTGLKGISDRSRVRKKTLETRCLKAAEIVQSDNDQWIIWCGLNDEANRMKQLLGDKAVNVQGSDKVEKKIERIKSFVDGDTRILISKTKICGHGANFQHCHKMIFVGISDSWESFYQAIKRIHRFMQNENCEIYVILSEEEQEIWDNVMRKHKEAEQMTKKLIENASQYQKEELDQNADQKVTYITDEIKTNKYRILLGDSCERMKEIKSNSIGLSVYSPPFEDLFVYSATERDLSNSANKEDFYKHYGYIVDELLRVTMPGRKTVVHVADIHTRKNRDGFIGLKDFSGNIIRLYQKHGWEYNGRIPIAKNPQATAIRLKAHELMFQTMGRDAIRLMPGQPDYLLAFTKPGKNTIPVLPEENGEMNKNDWIIRAGQNWLDSNFKRLEDWTENDFLKYAKEIWRQNGTIWQGIRETEVLSHKNGKERLNEDDTKHICPLQLDVVEWVLKLWSNPGETIFDPFMGIGTVPYQAVMFDRYGIGIELKPEYFYKAKGNIENAVATRQDLFDYAGIEVKK